MILFSPMLWLIIIIIIFVVYNFIAYLYKGRITTYRKLWIAAQLCIVIILPTWFLLTFDLPHENDCCSDSAIFSPEHRIGIYTLIVLSAIAFVISIFRKNIFPPIAELFLNLFLLLGLFLNIVFCKHLTTDEYESIWWIFGNIPIIMLLLVELADNQKLLKTHFKENSYSADNLFGKLCLSVLKLKPIFKYPILTVILVPVIMLLSLFLILFLLEEVDS